MFQYSVFLLLIFLLEAISGVLAYMYEGIVSNQSAGKKINQ